MPRCGIFPVQLQHSGRSPFAWLEYPAWHDPPARAKKKGGLNRPPGGNSQMSRSQRLYKINARAMPLTPLSSLTEGDLTICGNTYMTHRSKATARPGVNGFFTIYYRSLRHSLGSKGQVWCDVVKSGGDCRRCVHQPTVTDRRLYRFAVAVQDHQISAQAIGDPSTVAQPEDLRGTR